MKFSHCYIVRNDKIVFMQIILKIIFKRKKTRENSFKKCNFQNDMTDKKAG